MINIWICLCVGAITGGVFNLYFFLDKIEKCEKENIENLIRCRIRKRDILKLLIFTLPAGLSGLGMVFFIKWYFDITMLVSEVCYLVAGVTGIFWELIHKLLNERIVPYIKKKFGD